MAQMLVECYRYGHRWSTWEYSPIIPNSIPHWFDGYTKEPTPAPMRVMASRQCVRCGEIEAKEEER